MIMNPFTVDKDLMNSKQLQANCILRNPLGTMHDGSVTMSQPSRDHINYLSDAAVLWGFSRSMSQPTMV